MRQVRRFSFLCFCLFLFAGVAAAQDAPDPATLEEGRALTRQFAAGELDAVHGRFDARMREALSREQLGALHEQVRTQLGAETAVIAEQTGSQDGMRIYSRVARFEKAPDAPAELAWALAPDGSVAGFYIRPAQQPAPPTPAGDPQP
ncbi:hypothetical protein [Coralloluteibacterium thermophilus]|uniref:DUF3887 domain-containing protein n=1 Tax=Coralloluteibacterium thermophilum TaxID=2707049 RepID=A0ABV9NMR6_9GAMM